MAGGTPARQAAIATLVTGYSPEYLAALVVDALAIAGSLDDWDSETIEHVVAVLESTTLPDTAPTNTDYWRRVTGD